MVVEHISHIADTMATTTNTSRTTPHTMDTLVTNSHIKGLMATKVAITSVIQGDIIRIMVNDTTDITITGIVGNIDRMEMVDMPTDTILEGAAAEHAAGSDMLDGEHIQVSRSMRALRFIGLVGSAAIADMSIEVFIGDKRVGQFYNTTAGAAKVPTANVDLIPVGRTVLIPPGTRLSAIVVTASGTNPAALTIVADELGRGMSV